jgi:hypothetical protein
MRKEVRERGRIKGIEEGGKGERKDERTIGRRKGRRKEERNIGRRKGREEG